jgi:hypothetical protein
MLYTPYFSENFNFGNPIHVMYGENETYVYATLEKAPYSHLPDYRGPFQVLGMIYSLIEVHGIQGLLNILRDASFLVEDLLHSESDDSLVNPLILGDEVEDVIVPVAGEVGHLRVTAEVANHEALVSGDVDAENLVKRLTWLERLRMVLIRGVILPNIRNLILLPLEELGNELSGVEFVVLLVVANVAGHVCFGQIPCKMLYTPYFSEYFNF